MNARENRWKLTLSVPDVSASDITALCGNGDPTSLTVNFSEPDETWPITLHRRTVWSRLLLVPGLWSIYYSVFRVVMGRCRSAWNAICLLLWALTRTA